MKHKHLIIFSSVVVVAWTLGTFLLVYFWPHFVSNFYKKAIVDQGFGIGPIPVNQLYTEPQTLYTNPFAPLPSGSSNLMTVGVNHDTLLTVGWLDLSKGPIILHVPDMVGRYYSVQFTDPATGTDFAYVGTRTTGTGAGQYLIVGPSGKVPAVLPANLTTITSPSDSVLVIGRVLVESDSDVSIAHHLAQQIQLTPLSQR